MNTASERRAARRFPVRLPVALLVVEESARARAEVCDVSAGGLSLRVDVPLALGVAVGVKIAPTAERGRIDLFGYVRWVRGDSAGIELRGMLPNHRARFEDLLANLRRQMN